MEFTGICITTGDVPRLTEFYKAILKAEAEGDARHMVIRTEGVSLALFSKDGMEDMAPDSTAGIGAGCITLMFETVDADAEYERIVTIGAKIIKPLQTYPWGSRAFWFTDPDGNIIDFYTRLP